MLAKTKCRQNQMNPPLKCKEPPIGSHSTMSKNDRRRSERTKRRVTQAHIYPTRDMVDDFSPNRSRRVQMPDRRGLSFVLMPHPFSYVTDG